MEQQATLMIHTPGSHRVTMEDLATLPTPQPLGRFHQPVRHDDLVYALRGAFYNAGFSIARQELGVARKGASLFGVMDLRGGPLQDGETGHSFGFRSSTDQSLAIRGVAGARVFVCDNLSLSGEEFILQHKSTSRLNIYQLVMDAVTKFRGRVVGLNRDIRTLRDTGITEREAKSMLYDVFARGVLPQRLMPEVDELYFKPPEYAVDCQPRSLWGLHNACTRAIKELSPAQQFHRSVAVGKMFGLGSSYREAA